MSQVDVDIPRYYKKDFHKLSWSKYIQTLEILYGKVSKYLRKNKIKIDAVVPILRGGSFPGAYLAYRLHILKIVPIQYKYFFSKGKIELRRLFNFPKTNFKLQKKPVFLLVENNQCFGLTARTAAKYLRKKFPGCKIIHAADYADYSYTNFKEFDVEFYGKLTNDTRKLTKAQCKKFNVESFSNLFPWENMEEEWKTVHAEQFEYIDVK